MTRATGFFVVCGGMVLLATGVRTGDAQVFVEWIAETASYNDENNWADGFVPSEIVNEIATINNGGTAIVSDTPDEPGGVVLGQTAA